MVLKLNSKFMSHCITKCGKLEELMKLLWETSYFRNEINGTTGLTLYRRGCNLEMRSFNFNE